MSCHVNEHYGCHQGKYLLMEDLIMSLASKVFTFPKNQWKGLGPDPKLPNHQPKIQHQNFKFCCNTVQYYDHTSMGPNFTFDVLW